MKNLEFQKEKAHKEKNEFLKLIKEDEFERKMMGRLKSFRLNFANQFSELRKDNVELEEKADELDRKLKSLNIRMRSKSRAN